EKGALSFALNGAYLLTQKTTPLPNAHTYDCAGLYGNTCGTVNPRWHHNLRTTWSTPWNFDLAMTWRFLSPVKLDNNDSDPTLRRRRSGSLLASGFFSVRRTVTFSAPAASTADPSDGSCRCCDEISDSDRCPCWSRAARSRRQSLPRIRRCNHSRAARRRSS